MKLINLSEDELVKKACQRGEGTLTKDGALSVTTGKYTGRNPEAKAIVYDDITSDWVDWKINKQISHKDFLLELSKIKSYFHHDLDEYYVQALYANHDLGSRLNLEVYTSTAWQSHYARNMFNVPKANLPTVDPDWILFCAPEYSDTPQVLISFTDKAIVITGTHYAGEIKKSIFTVLNFLLPLKGILPMHCAVNTNTVDTSPTIFFGLSGTGKTTLSSDISRVLIGDDEHCWGEKGLYNFEGGCYAKTYNLSKVDEPDIWSACHKKYTILENVVLNKDLSPDFFDSRYTENSRASYPINHIANADPIGSCQHPVNIIMLTCDAFGVLPPVARLNQNDAIKHFLLGYTAKVAGTEEGITKPIVTFSHCYGSPFMPHRPSVYANLLLEKIKSHKANCWLINTGWSGGAYGIGQRMPIDVTRQIIKSIHDGSILSSKFFQHKYTKLSIPESLSLIDTDILHPERSWSNLLDYNLNAKRLLKIFDSQYKKMKRPG